jgi:hypothetical protein
VGVDRAKDQGNDIGFTGHDPMRPQRYAALALSFFAVFSFARCAQETEAQPTRTPYDASAYVMADASEDTFALGSRLTPAGAVADNSVQDLYSRGEKLFVAVDLTGSSRPTRDVEVRWLSSDGGQLHRDRRVVDVKKRYATFPSGMTSSWSAGNYRAIVVIDGREVAERPFRLK